MSDHAVAAGDNLPVGQILYAIQDMTVLFKVPGHKAGNYQLSFTGSEGEPRVTTDDWHVLPSFDDLRSVRAVTQWNGRQVVVAVGGDGLQVISSAEPPMSVGIDDAVLVIGIDPLETTRNSLILLVAKKVGFCLMRVDLETGVPGETLDLPPEVRGRGVAAEMVRRGPSTMLLVATIDEDSLRIHAMNWKDFSSPVASALVDTLTLGNILSDPTAEVSVVVTSMQAKSADQQLAVAWPDAAGNASIAVVGWEASGAAKLLATPKQAVNFVPHEKPVYRLAYLDLLHNGESRLILGYSATYGKVRGCAALMMFAIDEFSNLVCTSKYAVSNTDGQPWASIDLHLAAGVFGTCIGLQIVGAAASFAELLKGHASIKTGFVPVDINIGFPAMTGDVPGVPRICIDTETGKPAEIQINVASQRIFALPSDLAGQSVVLGPPVFTQRDRCAQILAIVQAPPFQNGIMDTLPIVTFSTSDGTTKGCTVSSDASWTLSDDVSVNLGLGELSLSRSTHNSYLSNLSYSKDDSFSSNVTLHASLSENDFLLVYESAYNVWRYPIVRSSVKEQEGGEMLMIYPLEANLKQEWIPAHSYAYRPRSEVGLLLSYVDLDPGEGFAEDKQLFQVRSGFTVTVNSDFASITFDESNSTTGTESRHSSVLNSVSSHLGITGRTEIFDYLPPNFGLNVGSSHSYAQSKVDTTHLTVHSNLTIGVSGGTVKDTIYEYQVTPYVYLHDQLGCIMLTYEVSLKGRAWRAPSDGGDLTLTEGQICLIRPVANSQDPIECSFSRSITMVEHDDGTMDIVVEIFNKSLTMVPDVSCDLFLGKPESFRNGLKLPKKRLGTAKLTGGVLEPLQRRKAILYGQKLSKPAYVVAQLFMGTIPCDTYWGIHPPEAFFGK